MYTPHRLCRLHLLAALGLALGASFVSALGQSEAVTIQKIDPPNWFAALPAPMLLVQGTGLHDAVWTISDAAIHVTRSISSPNGHWAMVWLDTQAAAPETIRVTAHSALGSVTVPYTLKPRRTAEAGPQGFSSRDVLYLIMPDRFADGDPSNDRIAGSPAADRKDPQAFHGGDLQGVIDHLDYLQELGVTALWLTPVVENNPVTSDYHGYGATDLYAVEPRLGTLAAYQRLAVELHRRGMKLVFDDVPNHVGPGIAWVTDPPAPDWFHGTQAHHLDNRYVFGPVTDPHATQAASRDAEDGWFVNVLPDFNQTNPLVAQYLTQNMIWWIEEAGIDGLRIDTFPYVQREFWQSYLSTLTSLYPRLKTVGEVSTPDPSINAYFSGGRTLDGYDTHLTTPFDYPMYYSLVDTLVGRKPMSQVEDTLRQDWLYPHPETLVPFFGNHDQERFLSQKGATPALLRLAYGLLLTMRGMPQIYAGDEIEMLGSNDPDNRRDFPGGFPGDSANAFTAAGRTPEQNRMHDWVAQLGRLRAAMPALQTGVQQTLHTGTGTFAFLRTVAPDGNACSAEGSLLIALNRDASPASIVLRVEGTSMSSCRTLIPTLGDAGSAPNSIADGTVTIELPPFGFQILKLR